MRIDGCYGNKVLVAKEIKMGNQGLVFIFVVTTILILQS
jgi:hypothetical protein